MFILVLDQYSGIKCKSPLEELYADV